MPGDKTVTAATIVDAVCTSKSSRPTTELYILAIASVVYIFSAKGYIEVTDTENSIQTAEAIVFQGRLDIPYWEGYTLQSPDGRSYSKYGIGLPLYYIPWISASHALSRATGFPTAELTGFLISFANIPLGILTVHLFAQCLRLLGVAWGNAWLLAVGLGLGTLCWRYACYDFSEAMQASLLLLAVYGALHRTRRAVLVGGLGFAGLVLVKLVHVALFPVLLGYLMARPSESPQSRFSEAALFALPVVLAGGLIACLNWVRFGNLLESGYGHEAAQFIPSQLWTTIPALLCSLDKGLFIFSPVLLLGAFGWGSFIRRRPWEALLCSLLIVESLFLAGAWHSWIGGRSYGPRLLVPTIPLWLMPAGFWLDSRRSRKRFVVAALVTLASVIAQVPGILVKTGQIDSIKHSFLTPEERPWAIPVYPATCRVLWHKLTARNKNEVYRVSEFGVPGDRELDLSEYRTYRGLNVWTEHVARQLNRPVVRWLPVMGLLTIGYCVFRLGRRLSTKMPGCR